MTAGSLPAGARLPTVRDVARELRVSPTTVSEAWGSLARAGAIQTRGRSGTFVAAASSARQRLRYAQLGGPRAGASRDLSTGVPDHDLLPDLTAALRRIGDGRRTSSYLDAPVLPRLEAAVRARLPFAPERVTVVDGALDALDRIIGVVVRLGDRVLVENPAFPPLLDLLDAVGATVVGVPLDAGGLVGPDLAAALAECRPVALFLQPRAHNPTGVSMTPARAAALAAVLAEHPGVTIVEDDHAGDIATAAPVSLGEHLSDRTVHVASFSKSHGPDLRLAAIGGPAALVTGISDRRLLGPGWSSRILQAVLADLLADPVAMAQVATARVEYARRRATLLAALAERGVAATAGDGINMWVAVDDQQDAMVALAAHGIAVAPGAPFLVSPGFVAPDRSDYVRLTCGLVRDGVDDLADVLASAALFRNRPHPRGSR